MAAELKAQEIRGMASYATKEPSENWGAEFHRKLAMWQTDLAAYEVQESAEMAEAAARRPAPAAGQKS